MNPHSFVALILFAVMATGKNTLADEKTQSVPEGIVYLGYPDVTRGHWAFETVNRASAFGIIEGHPDGLFRGDEPLKRYEFPILLARILTTDYIIAPTHKLRWKSLDDLEKDRLFPPAHNTDVPRGHYAYEAVQLVQRLGIMQGNPQNLFLGDKPLTRYEVTVALQRFMQLKRFDMVPVSQ